MYSVDDPIASRETAYRYERMADQETDGTGDNRTLADAIEDVQGAVKHYNILQEAYNKNSNYKFVDQVPNLAGEAQARILLGDLLRQQGVIKAGKEGAAMLEQADMEFNRSLEIFQSEKVSDIIGEANGKFFNCIGFELFSKEGMKWKELNETMVRTKEEDDI